MFTGIIEAIGVLHHAETRAGNLILTVASPLSAELSVDQSLSHHGVCLTVTAIGEGTHQVEAVAETLEKTNLRWLKPGDRINLERALTIQQRLDGHLVQGHVDAVGRCLSREDRAGSQEFRIGFPQRFAPLVIEKGSIALNGISLTVFDVTDQAFTVAVIPYTAEHTTMAELQPGAHVNLEFDLVGKYVVRWNQLQAGADTLSS